MSSNSTVATLLNDLPAKYISEAHRLALEMCNFALETQPDGHHLYLYTRNDEGPVELQVNRDMPFEEGWAEFLDSSGLIACDDESFVAILREQLCTNDLDWPEVLQLVLAEIPAEAIPHIDVQGSFWCDKERPAEFGGFAVRITRAWIHHQTSHPCFFRRLTRLAGDATTPAATRIENVVAEVLSSSDGLYGALAAAYPERKSDSGQHDLTPERASLESALAAYIRAWAEPTA